MIPVIDPHVHLIALAEGQYGWLQLDNPPYWPDKHLIARSFTPDDLTLSAPFELQGFVHVEAGFNNTTPWQEVAFFEHHYSQITQTTHTIHPAQPVKDPQTQLPTSFNTIATCDLTLAPDEFNAQIASLTAFKSCVGVRHILDDDARALLHAPLVIQNLRALSDAQLIFECQCDLTDSFVVEKIIDFHQQGAHLWVINHAGLGGYGVDDKRKQTWSSHIQALAQCPNIKIKLSGWEMVDREYTSQDILPIMRDLVEIFGIERVMLASNFPLTLFRQSYQDYWQMIYDVLVTLRYREEEQRALLGQNALETYFT